MTGCGTCRMWRRGSGQPTDAKSGAAQADRFNLRDFSLPSTWLPTSSAGNSQGGNCYEVEFTSRLEWPSRRHRANKESTIHRLRSLDSHQTPPASILQGSYPPQNAARRKSRYEENDWGSIVSPSNSHLTQQLSHAHKSARSELDQNSGR